MKKINYIICYIMALCSIYASAQNDSIDCCANCDMSCVHYERYSLRCTVRRLSQRMYFWFSDACGEIQLEEIPILDSIWITTRSDTETILFKSYNQVGDTIDVSFLAGGRESFLLHAQLGNCVKRRLFTVRVLPSNVDNADAENTNKNWQKVIRNGNLLIESKDNIYNAQGIRL